MLAQYLSIAIPGVFSIVRHGHRWRSLLDGCELGRHESPELALHALRLDWPQAGLPKRLGDWRFVPECSVHRRQRGTERLHA